MANLGNTWHIPGNAEPRGRGGMRDPVGALVPGTAVTVFSGNQFRGSGGNPGNQLQDGSSLFFQRAGAADWTEVPMRFYRETDNNKYYRATIDAGVSSSFGVGEAIRYYLRIAYDDHDTTFLRAATGGKASATTDSEAGAQAAPFSFALESPARWGRWNPVFGLPNSAIHTHVLPNGRVLMWGRRDQPTETLDEHHCTPFVWDPATGQITDTPQPKTANGETVNLFCSGHAFLPDGRLLVVGGHWCDSDGLNQATLYDWTTNTWTPTATMGAQIRRWYPTATALPDGGVLVLSGSFIDPQPSTCSEPSPAAQTLVVDLLQVWENGTWTPIMKADGGDLNFINPPLYPRMHVTSSGQVFMSGTNARTLLLKTSAPGGWTEIGFRAKAERQYAPAVMYDVDKVVYIGGGNDVPRPHQRDASRPPTNAVEVIDLSKKPPRWREIQAMHFRRRHHNATILPDGTILVTGGTRGGGQPDNGFNDLAPGQPVHAAESWDPVTEQWTELAAEEVDRCYHATAVLLPDATVLSAGGGEYRPGGRENPPEDTHREAQIFAPPYLFKGARPWITSAPASVGYGEAFRVETPQPNEIGKVSWVRLPSVTHAFDQNQRINFLPFEAGAGGLTVTAPASANVCPPGHYMLFILSNAGVPSVANIVQIQAAAPSPAVPEVLAAATGSVEPRAELATPRRRAQGPEARLQVYARRDAVAREARGTAVVVGITGTCPYGIGACWGGAYEALQQLEGVQLVGPIPNAGDSTATVFLRDEGLPALDKWGEQFRSFANGTYELRGVEVTLEGAVEERDGRLFLRGSGQRPPVRLAPLTAAAIIQWNQPARAVKPLDDDEALAYERLVAASKDPTDGRQVRVTGPLEQTDGRYRLRVRVFDA